VDDYAQKLDVKGLKRHLIEKEGVPPMVVYEVEGQTSKNVMVYGHLDKQPYGEGWDADKHPIDPVVQDGWMYGRGGCDDGYAFFSTLLAIKLAQT